MLEIKFNKNENKALAYENNIKIGECDYIETGEHWNIIHTEVDPKYQGKGVARKLVESILENAKIYNKKVTAKCSYADKIIKRK